MEPIQPPIQPIHPALPPGWITKPEAVALLNRNVKTFEQIVRQRGIESQLLENKGKRATPIYRRTDIERLVRPAAPTELTEPTQPEVLDAVLAYSRARAARSAQKSRLNQSNQPLLPGKVAPPPPPVPVDRLHLITQKQAHELGYPYQLLREMKKRALPPGIRYGKTGFRFSVPALLREVGAIGVG